MSVNLCKAYKEELGRALLALFNEYFVVGMSPYTACMALQLLFPRSAEIPFIWSLSKECIILDHRLTLQDHVSAVVKSLSFHFWNISKIKHFLTQADLLLVTHAIVLPGWITAVSFT